MTKDVLPSHPLDQVPEHVREMRGTVTCLDGPVRKKEVIRLAKNHIFNLKLNLLEFPYAGLLEDHWEVIGERVWNAIPIHPDPRDVTRLEFLQSAEAGCAVVCMTTAMQIMGKVRDSLRRMS
jgi:hypothetical protein